MHEPPDDHPTGPHATEMTVRPPRPFVDACALIFDSDCWRAYLARFLPRAPEYLDVFSAALSRFFSASHERYRDALKDNLAAAIDVLVPPDGPGIDPLAAVQQRANDGMVAEIAMGSPARLADGSTVNDRLLALTADMRDRVHVWAGIELTNGSDPLAQVTRAQQSGATGLCLIPFLDGVDITDRAYVPVFGAAADAGLPVWLHTGHHFAAGQPTGLGSWRAVETIAARHPDLVLVCGHAGWPDVMDTLVTAARHRHVYLEFSSHRPRRMAAPGSGWLPLLHHATSLARHRVMFGTSTWVNPTPARTLADEVTTLGLPEPVTSEWLADNALRMLAKAGKP